MMAEKPKDHKPIAGLSRASQYCRLLPSLFIISLSGFCAAAAQPGQDDLNSALKAEMHVIARRYQDSVVVRWAPSKAAIWRTAVGTGYVLERATLGAGNKPGGSAQLNDGRPVLPWGPERWDPAVQREFERGGGVVSYIEAARSLVEAADPNPEDVTPLDPEDLKTVRDRKSQFEMRYGFALLAAERSADAAEGLGLRYVDRTVQRGKSYVYRVSFPGTSPAYRMNPGTVTVGADPHRVPVRHGALKRDERDRAVLLGWQSLRDYSGFAVERSDDDGKTFRRLNSVPFITLRAVRGDGDMEAYQDTALINYKTYIYRAYGMTAFGDEERIGEVKATPRDRTAPAMPLEVLTDHIPPRTIRITWKMDEPVAPDLAGFHIGRDTSDEGTFRRITAMILPPGAREFTDTVMPRAQNTYYVVEAIDTAGNLSRSFTAYVAMTDSTPPLPPNWVSGRMDTNGVVRLLFHTGAERDIMGYRLLRANAPDHEFSAVIESFGNDTLSRARDTLLYDTVAVRTLTKFVYYRLVALDHHYNESDPSEILAVPRPDVIPPVPPVITDTRATDTSVVLYYSPSSSADNHHHIVWRRRVNAQRWDSVGAGGREDSVYTDRNPGTNLTFEYGVVAVDSAGLKSEFSNIIPAKSYDSGVRPPVKDLKAVYDSAKSEVRLSWGYQGLGEKYMFILYRGINGQPVTSYSVIRDSGSRVFTDNNLSGIRSLEYAVKVVSAIGAESRLSDPVRLKLR